MARAVVWFRRDLRLSDNPALEAAAKLGAEIIPLFIWAPEEEDPWAPGEASRWWTYQSLRSLESDLKKRGLKLIIRRGDSLGSLKKLISESQSQFVFWNRLYEPALRARDEKVKLELKSMGLEVRSFNSSLLFEPWSLETGAGKPFQVFTPFYNACLKKSVEEPRARPELNLPSTIPLKSESLDSLDLIPKIKWHQKLSDHWAPGEAHAIKEFQSFLNIGVGTYKQDRDLPSISGTSRLSPRLHFGEIGPRQVWKLTQDHLASLKSSSQKVSADFFLRELVWREFAHHVLYHFPETPQRPLRQSFERFPWVYELKVLRAWQRGETGIPIVDAGMRELWRTGWMHNRVRMIVGSFLTKHLLHSWTEGAKWFWDTLVDANLANNTLGWQWISGCGADAAPYFRIFNPSLQAEKFDPQGHYIQRWLPELKNGGKYPAPIIDLKTGRERALEAFKSIQ